METISESLVPVSEPKKERKKKEKINPRTVRFNTAPWYTPKLECIIIGLGGIGSYLAYYLGRQEAELHLFDMDIYDSTNLGGQFAGSKELTLLKTHGAKKLLEDFSGNTTVSTYGEYTDKSLYSAIMFCCPDNMEARETAFKNWQKYLEENKTEDCPKIFIEASMSAEDFSVRFVTEDKIKRYSEYLTSDVKIPELPCNFKATSHCGAMCAGLMVSGFNNYIANYKIKEDIREVPFEIQVSLSSLMFNVNI